MEMIEKSITLKAPWARVWRAVSDASEFGKWFGVAFDAPFVEGHRLTGRIVPTIADAEVAKMQAAYEGMPFVFVVETIEPMSRIVFRWHPYAVEKDVDYSQEQMTSIELHLEEVIGGTKLTITESGFDRIPIARRARAYAANDGGWEKQAILIQKYLALFPR